MKRMIARWRKIDDTDSESATIDDFDDKEIEHDSAFVSMRRIGCFAHSFQ